MAKNTKASIETCRSRHKHRDKHGKHTDLAISIAKNIKESIETYISNHKLNKQHMRRIDLNINTWHKAWKHVDLNK